MAVARVLRGAAHVATVVNDNITHVRKFAIATIRARASIGVPLANRLAFVRFARTKLGVEIR